MKTQPREFDRRITIEKLTVSTDTYENEIKSWEEHYRCAAGVNAFTEAVQTEERRPDYNTVIEFKVRYCAKTTVIVPELFRVIYGGTVYGILAAIDVNGAHQIIKIKAVVDSGKAQ